MTKKSKASRRRKYLSKKNRTKRLSESVAYETLEPKHMLAAITVGNATDVLSPTADTTSITALIDNNGGDGISLREAITAANNTTGEDTITFDASVFTGGDNSLIRLTQGELVIEESLSIDGTSVGGVVITGDADGDDVTLPGSNITDVQASLLFDASALDNNSRVLNFSSLTGDLTLDGLTVTGGRTTAANQDFLGTTYNGGGVRFVSDGALGLTNSTVSGNSTSGFSAVGGGIFASGIVTLTNSTVSGNSTSGVRASGGGIGARGDVTLTNSTVSGNSTSGDLAFGGGIFAIYTLTLSDSTVSGNSTSGDSAGGGGILAGGDVTLTNSTVNGNSNSGEFASGGGISANYATLTNSTVSGNSTSGDRANGGGIYSIQVTLTNSTVSGNSASGRGGGFALFLTAVPNPPSIINNSIVAGNFENRTAGIGLTGGPTGGFYAGTPNDLGPLFYGTVVNHSLIGVADNLGPFTGDVGNLTGTVDQPLDPLLGPLVDNGGRTQTHALLSGSPAIDAGDDALAVDAVGNALGTDQRGLPFVRSFDDLTVTGSGVDIGSFERQTLDDAALFVVNTTQDERDFSSDTISLREAIAFANGSAGEDTITFDASVFTGGDNNVIRLTQGELVIGESLSIDGTSVGGAVITGDAGGNDVTLPGSNITDVQASLLSDASALEDNSRVVNFTSSTGDLTLDGLTVTGGRNPAANQYFQYFLGTTYNGGGVRFVSDGALGLTNSTISGNSTSGFGGGIFARGELTLSDSTVSGNSATRSGGGIQANGRVTLTNSTVSGNSSIASGGGGGGINASGGVTLTNSTVSGNSTSGGTASGGGIKASGGVTLTDSTVSGNSTSGRGSRGGGIYAFGSVTLTNSTLSDNSSSGNVTSGGGIFVNGQSSYSITLTLTNSTVSGNSSIASGGGIFAISNVTLTNSTLTGNSASGSGGGLFLSDNSRNRTLTINNSIVAGNVSETGGTFNDLVSLREDRLTINHSLIGVADGLTLTSDNLFGTAALPLDPRLGPLADNGGPTQTHALLNDSPAIEAGDNDLAVNESGDPLLTDQRGESRVVGTVDIGAVEFFAEPFLLGDADLNGVVNFLDIQPFIDLLSSESFLDEADIDRNGVVDFLDIQPLVDLLASGGTAQSSFASSSSVAPEISSGSAVTARPILVESPAESPVIAAASVVSVAQPDSIVSVASPVSESSQLPRENVTVATEAPVDRNSGSAAFAPVEHGFLKARQSSLIGSQRNKPLVLRRSLAESTDRPDFARESRNQRRSAHDSSERSFSKAADLFDAHPEFVDEVFDVQLENNLAELIE